MNFKRILSLCLIITSIIGCSKPDYLLFDGSSGRLEDFNGKWLVINYWADWCPPCIKELPELSSFYEDNKDKVNVFTYNFDQLEDEELRDQIKRFKVEVPSILTNPEELFGWETPASLPATFIVDPNGNLQKELIGPQTQKSLEEIIKVLEQNL